MPIVCDPTRGGSNEYRDGDVVLVKARPLVARISGARYDHAALLWARTLQPGYLYTVEAGATGVRAYVGGHWGRPYDVFRPEGATERQGQKAVDAALERLGEAYAFTHLVPILGRMLRRRVGVQAVVCTELVQAAWMAAGVELCAGNPRPTPDELWEALNG